MNSYQFFDLVKEVRMLQVALDENADDSTRKELEGKLAELDAEIERVSKIPKEKIEYYLNRREAIMLLFDGLDLIPK